MVSRPGFRPISLDQPRRNDHQQAECRTTVENSTLKIDTSKDMSNNQDKRKTWSHESIAERVAMTSDPKRIMRNWAEPLLPTTFRQAENRHKSVQEMEQSLKVALESDSESPLFKQITGLDPAPATNPSISDRFIAPKSWNAMRIMAWKNKVHHCGTDRPFNAEGGRRRTVCYHLCCIGRSEYWIQEHIALL